MASPAIGIEKLRKILEFRGRPPTIFPFWFTRRFAAAKEAEAAAKQNSI
jgi:hypothetical protein